MKRIALETFYGDPMKEASGRLPPLSGASQYTTSYSTLHYVSPVEIPPCVVICP